MAGRHDSAMRRKATRAGRRTGCYIYIPGEDLRRVGLADTWPLYFRTYPGPKRKNPGVVVVLYAEP